MLVYVFVEVLDSNFWVMGVLIGFGRGFGCGGFDWV